jgi:xanthine/uracil/vitamin C permease (AzgA family)
MLLVAIGSLILAAVARITFEDLSEQMPPFLTMAFISLTCDIHTSRASGLLSHPLLVVISSHSQEIRAGILALALPSHSLHSPEAAPPPGYDPSGST